MPEYRIGAIMRETAPILTPETPIRRAIAVLVDAHISAAPVLDDNGQLAGILSARDCFRPALHASYHREWSGTVADHMSTDVVSVALDDELMRVAEMFLDHPHRVFPVLDDARVAGMLHRSDVLALLMRFG